MLVLVYYYCFCILTPQHCSEMRQQIVIQGQSPVENTTRSTTLDSMTCHIDLHGNYFRNKVLLREKSRRHMQWQRSEKKYVDGWYTWIFLWHRGAYRKRGQQDLFDAQASLVPKVLPQGPAQSPDLMTLDNTDKPIWLKPSNMLGQPHPSHPIHTPDRLLGETWCWSQIWGFSSSCPSSYKALHDSPYPGRLLPWISDDKWSPACKDIDKSKVQLKAVNLEPDKAW